MSQFILLDHIKVQNANAIAGLTWGFPAITHFLGFVHNLTRKLASEEKYQDIAMSGCAVVAHEHYVHTYGEYEQRFIQSRNPPYMYGLEGGKKSKTPSVVEEGKMNMTVSLLVECHGSIGNRIEEFRQWLQQTCYLQRLAGGTILNIANVSLHQPEDKRDVIGITRRLLPGFVLYDRSSYLEEHFQNISEEDPDAELLDAWLDFSALKQKARPKSDLIAKHLKGLVKKEPENPQWQNLVECWSDHLENPYDKKNVPKELQDYFAQLGNEKDTINLIEQWRSYCQPNDKTAADWQYVKKPMPGYLVPIMIGYKAISKVYDNAEISNTRDTETDVCFIESVHSVGEWQSAHRLKEPDDIAASIWRYSFEENWYLCQQGAESSTNINVQNDDQQDDSSEDFYN